MQTVEIGSYVAYLDPMTGSGLLVVGHPTDIRIGLDSLDEAEWNSAMQALDGLGWEPSESESGDVLVEGRTRDNRSVIGLYGREPIDSEPSIEACAAAFAELAELAGLAREKRP